MALRKESLDSCMMHRNPERHLDLYVTEGQIDLRGQREDGEREYLQARPEQMPNDVFSRSVFVAQTMVGDAYARQKVTIRRLIRIALFTAFLVYVGFAVEHESGTETSYRLLIGTVLGVFILTSTLFGNRLEPVTLKLNGFLTDGHFKRTRLVIKWTLYIINTVAILAMITFLVALDKPENLWSLAGLAGFVVIGFVTSYSPAQVQWHAVFWGLSLQFYFACFILKTDTGYEVFKWLSDRVTEFLSYSDTGASFVFGDYAKIERLDTRQPIQFFDAFALHSLAFKILPVITYFNTVITVLYYLGVMQACIKVVGRFLAFCLETTPAESFNAAGNIFGDMTVSFLAVRPFIPTMTRSELHAVMTSGFATIAGSVFRAYIDFGVPSNHLLSASVMSAPAALAISKLTYPEIEIPDDKNTGFEKIDKTKKGSVIEAACDGATITARIIGSIIVNLIAFVSLLKFMNSVLTWLGERVGQKNFTFELICSYLLYPVALFMGTTPSDCRRVAELVGVKTFINEFVAYERLAVLLNNRKAMKEYEEVYPGLWELSGQDINLTMTGRILTKGILEQRSEIIATYALCGFSNFGSIGIILGGLSAMAPSRRPTMAKLVLRAMLAGNVACFFTACIAGLFYEPRG